MCLTGAVILCKTFVTVKGENASHAHQQVLTSSRNSLLQCTECKLLLHFCAMPSQRDVSKRALVTLLLLLSATYVVPISICRDSPDEVVLGACRKVVRKVNPDRGGLLADAQKLTAARDNWDAARRSKKSAGRPRKEDAKQAPSKDLSQLTAVCVSF